MTPDAPAIPSPVANLSLTRRRVLAYTGLAAAAVSGLSACASYGASPDLPASSSGGGTGTSIPTADIPVGGGKIFPDAEAVVTQPTAGEFKAFSSICTHQNCPVAEVTETINCNCHGSKFSITDGSVVNPPAATPLPAKSVTVDGDTLTLG